MHTPREQEEGGAGPRQPQLTWEGVVTLISGTKVSSNRLRICSCLTSFDGVCLGGGGTGGPFRSCGSTVGEGQHREAQQSMEVRWERGEIETKPWLVTSQAMAPPGQLRKMKQE